MQEQEIKSQYLFPKKKALQCKRKKSRRTFTSQRSLYLKYGVVELPKKKNKEFEINFWNTSNEDNKFDDSFILGAKETFTSHFIWVSIYTIKRMILMNNDLKTSCEFEPCSHWEFVFRNLNTYLCYLFTWDIIFPSSVALCTLFNSKKAKMIFWIGFLFMAAGSLTNFLVIFPENYTMALSFSEPFEAIPAYIAFFLTIGINKQLKAIILPFICNITYIVVFYLINETFKNLTNKYAFQLLILLIENFYSKLSNLDLQKMGWHAENYVLLLRVYSAWLVGLKISGLLLYCEDEYEMFKYMMYGIALTIVGHTNVLKILFKIFILEKIKNVYIKKKLNFFGHDRSMAQKFYFGTFYDMDFCFISVLFYFYINHAGYLSFIGVDLDKNASVGKPFVLSGSMFLMVFSFIIFGLGFKYLISQLIFRNHKQILYYRIKNYRLRFLCDGIAIGCAYFSLINGYTIQKNIITS